MADLEKREVIDPRRRKRLRKKKKGLTRHKACLMLHEGKAESEKQHRYFAAVCHRRARK